MVLYRHPSHPTTCEATTTSTHDDHTHRRDVEALIADDDASAAASAAALLTDEALAHVAAAILDVAEPHGWDQPPRLWSLVAADQAFARAGIDPRDHLPADDPDGIPDGIPGEIAAALRGGLTVSGDRHTTAYLLRDEPLDQRRHHPVEMIDGVGAPADAAALALVTETWAHMPDHAAADGPLADADLVDGRAEARQVTVVTRLGAEAHTFTARGSRAEPQTRTTRPEDATLPYHGVERRRHAGGRLPDMLRRAFALPTAPPWHDMGEWTIGFVAHLAADNPDRADQAVDLLPDCALAPVVAAASGLGGHATYRDLADALPDQRHGDGALIDTVRAVAWQACDPHLPTLIERIAVAIGACDEPTARWRGGHLLALDQLDYGVAGNPPRDPRDLRHAVAADLPARVRDALEHSAAALADARRLDADPPASPTPP